MKVTVILCTYNRCRSLARTLNSLTVQELPESLDWQVLIVDNNSKDQTREVVEDFCLRHPRRFRYLFEHQQGLSYARNAGVREAGGDVLAFTDDDVTLEPTWLWNLTSILLDGEYAGSGGRILAEQAFVPPRWLPVHERYALAPLTIFDGGPDSFELTDAPFGANMAFQKTMFEKHGVFRTDLGRCGEGMLSNEDTEFGLRLLAAGERLRYEASAVVYHPVTENRMQKKYFLAWWFGKGRANIRQWGIPSDTRWRVTGIPLVHLGRLAVLISRWLFALKPSARFCYKFAVWEKAGEILECYRLSRDREMEHSIAEKFGATEGIAVQSDQTRP
jgi:glycosyltransferase involved in cell wall biosynthesis